MGLVQKLVAARERAGLTQARVAKRLQVTRPTITRIEGGTRGLTAGVADRWAEACGYRIEVVPVATVRDAESLAAQLATLKPDDLELLSSFARVLGSTDDAVRRQVWSEEFKLLLAAAEERGRPS